MANFTRFGNNPAAAQSTTYDVGLRQYMLKVYNYMASGLALTGILALVTANTPALLALFYQITPDGRMAGMTPLGWIVAFAPIGVVLLLSFAQQRLSPAAAQMWFWVYAGLMGLSLSSLFLMYTGASIARVFFITSGVFGAMSIYGYTTKRDLTGMGAFLFMGVIGVFIAGIVNIFLQSPVMSLVMSVIGVLLAVGLTAYDTQKIKEVYYNVSNPAEAQKAAVMGALTLYIDFIYLFINLMRLMGQQRN